MLVTSSVVAEAVNSAMPTPFMSRRANSPGTSVSNRYPTPQPIKSPMPRKMAQGAVRSHSFGVNSRNPAMVASDEEPMMAPRQACGTPRDSRYGYRL